jgi:hypothetical protein
LNTYFFVALHLVAAALLARDPAAVVSFDRGSHHAAALSWANGDATWADADGGVRVVPPPTVPVAVVAVPPDLNIDAALGNLDAMGLGRSDEAGQSSAAGRCTERLADRIPD